MIKIVILLKGVVTLEFDRRINKTLTVKRVKIKLMNPLK